jgi:hypothetical protein
VKYIVQKVPSRSIEHLQKQIPGLVAVEDRERNPVGCFANNCIAAGGGAFVRLEDDVDLCAYFTAKVEDAVALYPAEIISFFTLRKISGLTRFPGREFCMFQCVYFPDGLAQMVDYYRQGTWPRRAKNPKDPDSFVADFLSLAVRRSYLIWYPNLVQHQVCVSEIDPKRSRFRQSKIFEK